MRARLSRREDLALALTFLRWLREWEQKDLAAASGVSYGSIVAIEESRRKPSPKMLNRLTAGLGVPVWIVDHLVWLIRVVRAGGLADGFPGEATTTAVGQRSLAAPVLTRELRALLATLPSSGQAAREPLPWDDARRQAPDLWRRLDPDPAHEDQTKVM
jgi:transcriptional regulator with XRE-family HTH domain